MKRIIPAFAIILFLFSCNTDKKVGFLINGNIDGLKEGRIILMKMINMKRTQVDAVSLVNGQFTFKGLVHIPEIYYIMIPQKKDPISLFVENSQITIKANIDSLEKAKISGSISQSLFESISKDLKIFETKLDTLIQKSNKTSDTAVLHKIEKEIASVEKERKDFLINFVITNNSTAVSPYITYNELAFQTSLAELQNIVNSTDSTISRSFYFQLLKDRIEVLKKVAPGQPAPEITQVDTLGNPISMEKFKGKYLLIDFWASWCKPCRVASPSMVELYKQYNPKGIEFLGISLDVKKDNWINAIKKDKLNWQHAADLKGWENSVAKSYGIMSIPNNALIDKDGKIIATGLKETELKARLKEIFK